LTQTRALLLWMESLQKDHQSLVQLLLKQWMHQTSSRPLEQT
jgi:hypothetical protein